MDTLLITGGSGFIGTYLAARIAHKYRIICADIVLPEDSKRIDGVQYILADIRDGSGTDLPHADIVVHLAQATGEDSSNPLGIFKVNVMGTLSVCEHARLSGTKRMVFASSCSVYGSGEGPFKEGDEIRPQNIYQLSKSTAEGIVRMYSDFMETAILRLNTPYGPGQNGRLIPKLMERIGHGDSVYLNEGGGPRISPIFIEDLLDALEASIGYAGNLLINICGTEAVNVRDISEIIGSVMGVKPIYRESKMKSGLDCVCENHRMISVLGVEPRYSMEAGLRKTVEGG